MSGELDVARRVGLVIAVLLALSSLLASPRGEITDHHVYVSTVDRMHRGEGYYDAMDEAMREVYGPSESVRAFRMPTLFLLWRLLPSSAHLRAAFAAMAVVTALAVFAVARNPVSPAIVVAYLLNAGGVGLRRGDAAQ